MRDPALDDLRKAHPDEIPDDRRPRRRTPPGEKVDDEGRRILVGSQGEICLGEASFKLWTLCDGRRSIVDLCEAAIEAGVRDRESAPIAVRRIVRDLVAAGLLDLHASRDEALQRFHRAADPLDVLETREDFSDLLDFLGLRGWGVELGARHGAFSRYLLETTDLEILFSVDAWDARGYGAKDYRQAVQNLAHLGTRSVVLRMRFEQAVRLFDDGSLDFVYLDGFADSGAVRETLEVWWPKLREGGLLAGHDYSPAWPEVVRGVDAFTAARSLETYFTREMQRAWNCGPYPSWLILRGAA